MGLRSSMPIALASYQVSGVLKRAMIILVPITNFAVGKLNQLSFLPPMTLALVWHKLTHHLMKKRTELFHLVFS